MPSGEKARGSLRHAPLRAATLTESSAVVYILGALLSMFLATLVGSAELDDFRAGHVFTFWIFCS